MRNLPRYLLLVAGVWLSLTGVGVNDRAAALQSPPQAQPPKRDPAPKPKQTDDEGPVAVTPPTVKAAVAEIKTPASDEFGNFRYPIINNQGDVAFIGLFATASDGFGQAIFLKKAGGGWSVTRDGERPAGAKETIAGISNFAMNNNGDLTFIASLSGDLPANLPAANDPHAPAQKNSGVVFKSAAGVKFLAKLGEEVPNMPSVFSGFSNPSSNSKGATAFIGTYSDPDGRGVFLYDQGKLQLVARSGQRIGNGEEGTFSEHYYPSTINERGELAFFSRVGFGGGIFVVRPDKRIELVAYQGKPTPLKGASFIGFGNRAPSLNSRGDVAFVAFYDGPEAGRALFLRTDDGKLQIVARSGETVAGTTYNFTDFLNPVINSRGDIAFIGLYGSRTPGLFIKTAKGIEEVAHREMRVPGVEKQQFNNFVQLSFNDRADLVFYGQYKTADVGLFIKDAQGLRPLARRGDKMPK